MVHVGNLLRGQIRAACGNLLFELVSHEEEAQAAKAIMNIAQFLKPNLDKNSIVLGPTPKSIARMNRKYYYQLVIKYKQDTQLHQLLTQMMDQIQKQSRHGVQISIDPEPQNFI